VPVDGAVYELDGLRPGPVRIGACSESNWLDVARAAIQERVQRYASKEIRFNLMAIVKNRKDLHMEQINAVRSRRLQLEQRFATLQSPNLASSAMDTTDDVIGSMSLDEVKNALRLNEEEEKQLLQLLQDEEVKFQRWKIENVRRKHNYIPFIFNLLKTLAQKGKLAGLVEQAVKATAERNTRRQVERQKDKAKDNNKQLTTNKQ